MRTRGRSAQAPTLAAAMTASARSTASFSRHNLAKPAGAVAFSKGVAALVEPTKD